jgi:hypothetical protein
MEWQAIIAEPGDRIIGRSGHRIIGNHGKQELTAENAEAAEKIVNEKQSCSGHIDKSLSSALSASSAVISVVFRSPVNR